MDQDRPPPRGPAAGDAVQSASPPPAWRRWRRTLLVSPLVIALLTSLAGERR